MSDQAVAVGSTGPAGGDRAVPDLSEPPRPLVSIEVPASRSPRRAAVAWSVAVVILVVAAVVVTAGGREGTETVSAGVGVDAGAAIDRLAPEHRALVRREGPDGEAAPADQMPAGALDDVDVGPILDRLDDTAPERTIGGAWLAGRSGPDQRLVIESTADAAGRSALQAAADRMLPGRVVIVSGRYDRAALEAYKERAYAVVSAAGLTAGVGFSVRDLDLGTGSSSVVLVTLDSADLTDDLLARLVAHVPADLLQVSAERVGR